jgi:hypothetical protein
VKGRLRSVEAENLVDEVTMTLRRLLSLLLVFLLLASALAKDTSQQVIVWPESGAPVLRFTFGRFREIGEMGSQRTYVTDTTAQNLWDKTISLATFSLYLFDKNKARIGEGFITVSNVGLGETIKFQTTVGASGVAVSISLVPQSLPKELGPKLPAKTVSMTVNSVPQGALLKVDGAEMGATPKLVSVGVGKHTLEFSKEGFNSGKFPLEIGPEDVSGGSVSYELGASAYDTVELRDGSVLNGDLLSVSGMDVSIRVGGTVQHVDRNRIKRISLVERDAPASPALPPPQTNP